MMISRQVNQTDIKWIYVAMIIMTAWGDILHNFNFAKEFNFHQFLLLSAMTFLTLST